MKSFLKNNLKAIADLIITRSINEIKEQGHIINVSTPGYSQTGEDSFEYELLVDESTLKLVIWGNDYFLEMDGEVDPSNIDWDPFGMLEYGRIIYPGQSDESIITKLEALKKRQKLVGVPTPEAYNHTKNGRRTNWTEHAILSQEAKIEDMLRINSAISQLVEGLVESIV